MNCVLIFLFSILVTTPVFLFDVNGERFPSPKDQMDSGTLPIDVKCNDSLQIIFKKSSDSVACVKQSSVEKLVTYGWGIPVSMVEVKNADMWIRYQFNNGEILSVKAFGTPNVPGPGLESSVSLIISLNALQDSNLNINLPRELIDSKSGEDDDNLFVVEITGQELEGQELEITETITPTNRILIIPIHQGEYQLEIIGYGYYKEGLPLPLSHNIMPET